MEIVGRTCLLLASVLLASSCSRTEPSAWTLDPVYSGHLTIGANSFKANTGTESAETPDILHIYRVNGRRYGMYGLDWLFEQNRVFQTRSKDVIAEFYTAAQTRDSVIKNCFGKREGEILYVLALDTDTMRAGLFYLTWCVSGGSEHGMITPYDSNAVIGNHTLIPILKRIGVL